MTMELHPLCTLFPRMGGAEFDALVADIAANGMRDLITVHDGMILDGGNRFRACEVLGIEPLFQIFDGASPVAFVLSKNLHRRHMTAGQQAAIVASAQDWGLAQGRGGDRKSDQSATLHFDSAEKRAAESGASVRTQKMADKVAKADPKLAREVAHGEISLPKAVAKIDGKDDKKKKVEPEHSGKLLSKKQTDRLALLEEENIELRDQVSELSLTVTELNEKVVAAQAVINGEEAQTIIKLQAECRRLENDRDAYKNKCGQMAKQIKLNDRNSK